MAGRRARTRFLNEDEQAQTLHADNYYGGATLTRLCDRFRLTYGWDISTKRRVKLLLSTRITYPVGILPVSAFELDKIARQEKKSDELAKLSSRGRQREDKPDRPDWTQVEKKEYHDRIKAQRRRRAPPKLSIAARLEQADNRK